MRRRLRRGPPLGPGDGVDADRTARRRGARAIRRRNGLAGSRRRRVGRPGSPPERIRPSRRRRREFARSVPAAVFGRASGNRSLRVAGDLASASQDAWDAGRIGRRRRPAGRARPSAAPPPLSGGMRGSCGRSCSRKAADAAARRPVARLRRSLRGCGSRGRRPETGGSSAGCGGVEETPAHPGGSRPAATALGSGRCVAPPRCGPGDGCASSGARRRAARRTRAFGT